MWLFILGIALLVIGLLAQDGERQRRRRENAKQQTPSKPLDFYP